MKKVTVLVCSLAITVVLGLAACEPANTQSSVPAISSQISSESQMSSTASLVISEPEETASSATSEVGVNPGEIVDGYSYSIKRTPYTWEKGAKKYEVNYLRILGDKDNSYSKVNILLKERAMRMANSFGYQPQYDPATNAEVPVKVTTTSELAFRNDQFISVIIRTEYTVGDAESVSVLDTVNCYLDEGSALTPEETEVTMQNSLEVEGRNGGCFSGSSAGSRFSGASGLFNQGADFCFFGAESYVLYGKVYGHQFPGSSRTGRSCGIEAQLSRVGSFHENEHYLAYVYLGMPDRLLACRQL